MSTDSTELTFIRCPSCRSLVPAVSPRCRMCGAVLEAGKSDSGSTTLDGESAAKKSSSRVRQHTVAMNSSDVKAARKDLNPEEAFNSLDEEASVAAAKADSQSASLSASGSESASRIAGEVEQTLDGYESGVASEPSSSNDSVENTDFGDPLGAFIEEIPVDETLSAEKDSANAFNGSGSNSNGSHDESEKSNPTVANEQRSRVVVESGNRRSGIQKGGLSFGKGSNAAQALNSQEENQAGAGAKQFESKQTIHNEVNMESANESALLEPMSEIKKSPTSDVSKSGPIVLEGGSSKGKLYGWLVSYADPRGLATELRDGKFFISRASLKGTDLILDDDSISTPHALMAVSVKEGLQIQDLMSDRGLFVRRKAGEAYQRILESTKLEHGNWVRFGDVEFLVAILTVPTER